MTEPPAAGNGLTHGWLRKASICLAVVSLVLAKGIFGQTVADTTDAQQEEPFLSHLSKEFKDDPQAKELEILHLEQDRASLFELHLIILNKPSEERAAAFSPLPNVDKTLCSGVLYLLKSEYLIPEDRRNFIGITFHELSHAQVHWELWNDRFLDEEERKLPEWKKKFYNAQLVEEGKTWDGIGNELVAHRREALFEKDRNLDYVAAAKLFILWYRKMQRSQEYKIDEVKSFADQLYADIVNQTGWSIERLMAEVKNTK